MSLLSTPPEWASWWTYRQILVLFSDVLSVQTKAQLILAHSGYEGRDLTLSLLWKDLDFCSQIEIAEQIDALEN